MGTDADRGPINLVCLDMAGTTVRDDGAVMAAFSEALAAAGLHAGTAEHASAADYARQTMGQSKIEVFRAVFGGEESRARHANAAFEDAYRAFLDGGGVEPVPGAEDAIRELRAGGVKVALTTGFSPDTRDALIAGLGWQDLCDLALSPADAGRGRPYPDMLLTAVLKLGVDDVRAVAAAGDTASDLNAATRAGASIVAGVLTGALGLADFAELPHTHVLASVAELPEIVAAHNGRAQVGAGLAGAP